MEIRSLVWLSGLALFCADIALAQEDPKDIVAAAVRKSGQECSSPENVKPSPEHSSPDEKAWIIDCENGTFLVKFMGDRGAAVERFSE